MNTARLILKFIMKQLRLKTAKQTRATKNRSEASKKAWARRKGMEKNGQP